MPYALATVLMVFRLKFPKLLCVFSKDYGRPGWTFKVITYELFVITYYLLVFI